MDIISEDELTYISEAPYKLCTFSRVLKEKGIEDAVQSVKNVNNYNNKTIYSLDIYGQVDPAYEDQFMKLSESFPSYIKYMGTVPFDHTTVVIKDYFAMLFPTYYEGEGFAGCLIDAFSSGVPVIASDWKYNGEFVDNQVGYLFKAQDVAALTELLDQIKDNVDETNMKKVACLKRAYQYTSEAVIGIIIDRISG